MDGHQVSNGDTTLSSPTVSGWFSFDSNGSLMNNDDVRAPDVDLSFQKRVSVQPGQTQSLYFYIGVCDTQSDVNDAIRAAKANSGESWFSTTAAAYQGWLASGNQGRRVHFDDSGINTMFDRALIMIKNVQNPVSGSFAATTNPFAYQYKNWVRDSAITSIALDAAGHHAEADRHWRWLAGRQSDDGTWKTTYDTWDSSYVPFVEPEFDSIGAFLYGVYRHYALTADSQFLDDLWPNVKRAGDWVLTNISPNGAGRADYSIWEEDDSLEHNSYTQAWYIVGLYAVQCMAEARGDTALSDWYAGGPGAILTFLQKPCDWYPPGNWNPSGYYNRAVRVNNSVQPLIDSSSDVLITLGALDHDSKRSESHIATVLRACTQQIYGICRYPGDMFYYTGAWSPGGNEALGPEPSWPQMSLWIAVYDMLKGDHAAALSRLQWFVSIAGKGYMPPGEAVSNVTLQPLPSSMCEPLTASAFILAALAYEGQDSIAIVPPVYNAGTAKSITVSPGLAGDLPQWTNVPYFVGPQSPSSAPPMLRIKRVYITNDSNCIYIRLDNGSGAFSAFAQQPVFALNVYSQDFAGVHTPVSNFGISGQPLRRPMSYMVERRSDADAFRRWAVSGGVWSSDHIIDWVAPPQWDPSSGKLVATIPISMVSSVYPGLGNAWANMLVLLTYCDSTAGTWHDGESMLLHYRLSSAEQNWTYGNIEQ
jgi:GH15 family glucan-1,4-alpha-glucosidase